MECQHSFPPLLVLCERLQEPRTYERPTSANKLLALHCLGTFLLRSLLSRSIETHLLRVSRQRVLSSCPGYRRYSGRELGGYPATSTHRHSYITRSTCVCHQQCCTLMTY